MCIYRPSHESPLTLNFRPLNTKILVFQPEVVGHAAGAEPTQDDAEAVSAAIENLYHGMTPAQQAFLEQLLLQAGQSAG